MARLSKSDRLERDEAIARLREWIKPGDTVYTILDHVSRSGMMRHIRVLVPQTRREAKYSDGWREIADGVVAITDTDHGGQLEIRCVADFIHPNHAVSKALGIPQAKGDGLKIGGCGMDMGFHLVYELSHALYGSLRCESCGKHPSGEYRTVIDAEFKATYNNQYPSCEYCGAALVGGYQCLGKGKCPSNYHVNHRDHIRCPNACSRSKDDGVTRVYWTGDDEADAPRECTSCDGGYVPNPEGPERWDLLHTDGYAIRHRWL